MYRAVKEYLKNGPTSVKNPKKINLGKDVINIIMSFLTFNEVRWIEKPKIEDVSLLDKWFILDIYFCMPLPYNINIDPEYFMKFKSKKYDVIKEINPLACPDDNSCAFFMYYDQIIRSKKYESYSAQAKNTFERLKGFKERENTRTLQLF